MDPERTFAEQVVWVMEKIKHQHLMTLGGENVHFLISVRPWPKAGDPPASVKTAVINKLAEWGAIIIHNVVKTRTTYGPDTSIYLEIVQPKFDGFYDEYMEKFDIVHSLKKLPEKIARDAVSEPKFDEQSGKIIWDEDECQIPLGTNQYFFCKKMFSTPFETRVKEIDILNLIDWDKDSKRSVYDAMRAINKRIKDHFGVEQLFEWSNNNTWINTKLLKK